MHDVTQAPGNHTSAVASLGQHQRLGEQLAGHDAERRRHKGSEHIQPNGRAEAAVQLDEPCASALATMTKTSTGAMPFSAPTNRLPSSSIHAAPGANQRQRRTDDWADGDAQNQAGLITG